MQNSEPDQREVIGYSVADPGRKREWVDLVAAIERWLSDHSLETSIVFHGTSDRRATKILTEGIKPVDVGFALGLQADEGMEGSYWGNVRTAAAYAEDTVSERDPDGLPVLLAITTASLEELCVIRPDGNTIDFPLKGLTRLDDSDVADKWFRNFRKLSWQESLLDLGAVVALHDFMFSEGIFMANSVENVRDAVLWQNCMHPITRSKGFG